MADSIDSGDIARKNFEVGRRGYEQQAVRAFLHEVSSLVDRLQRETTTLRERAERAEARVEMSAHPDEAMLIEVLGEETTRVLTSAREAANDIRSKAEAAAERLISEATAEAASTRASAIEEADRRIQEATSESESMLTAARAELELRAAEAREAAATIREEAAAEIEQLLEEARERGRELIAEAQAVRERVLRDLAARRKRARQQVEKLNAGRERLLEAYEVVRRTADEASVELRTALPDARLAGEAAARLVEDEPEETMEELDAEVAAAAIPREVLADIDVELPEDAHEADPGAAGEDGDADEPGPLSGEVPAVGASEPPAATGPAPVGASGGEERRGRKGRRRKQGFEGLPEAELQKVEPPAEGEGVRVLSDEPPADAPAPEPAAEPEPATVDDLFQKLRQGQDEAEAEPEVEAEAAETGTDAEGEAEDAEEPEEEVEEEPTPFTERDAAVAPMEKDFARRLKRALADEENEVLDLLRRVKPKGADDLLPDADEHASRWADTIVGTLDKAAAAGASSVGGKGGSMATLATELAVALTGPLRERIDRSFAASDGDLDDVTDRVRALYREWKGQRLTETSRHYVAAAYARGAFDSLPDGAQVQWMVDPKQAPCPDCDDNVLAGSLTKGEEFPTGNAFAPAHPGCRCLVLLAES